MTTCKTHAIDINKHGMLCCSNCRATITGSEARELLKKMFISEDNIEKIMTLLVTVAKSIKERTFLHEDIIRDLVHSFRV